MKNRALVSACLACVAAARVTAEEPRLLPLAAEQFVAKRQTLALPFDLPAAPDPGTQQVRLGFRVRVQYPDCANNPAMVVAVNGRNCVGGDLLNKPLEYTDKNGRDVFWALPKDPSWYLYSWHDFSLESAWACESPYAVSPGVDPFEFVLDITPYVQPGPNRVTFTHPEIVADLDHRLVLRELRIEIGAPIASKASPAILPAPSGPLPVCVAQGAQEVEMTAQLGSGGSLRLQVGKRSFELTTQTSDPEGRWVVTAGDGWQTLSRGGSATAGWTGTGYRVRRSVTRCADHLQVADTFTNTSDILVGVMLEHRLSCSEKPEEVRLAALPPYAPYHQEGGGTNPTALARWPDLAVGLVAEDDIFRAHVKEFARPDAIGLADHELGLEPGQSHTLEWSVYPVPGAGADYWDFINAVRRNWGANFTLPGPLSFVDWSTTPHAAEYYRSWLAARGMKLVNAYDAMFDEGHAAMGTAIPLATRFCAQSAAWIKQVHAVAPGVQALFYMNATLCTEPGAREKYADSAFILANGSQETIAAGSPQGVSAAPCFVCTLDNSYGKAMRRTVEFIINELQADGLYHDVFNLGMGYATRTYGPGWDGCTVSIDPATHRVTGKASSAGLLQLPWEMALIQSLRERGKMFMANGPVESRSLLRLKIPVFCETGFSFSELYKTHLGSPWGYGNHPVPDPGRDVYCRHAYQLRRMLDVGGILAIPNWNDDPKGLTFLHLLYPITPVELRPGIVHAEERILTNRSGRFGWPDNAVAEVHVFDGSGQPVEKPLVEEVRVDGRVLYEVRLPGDHFAILVKQAAGVAPAP